MNPFLELIKWLLRLSNHTLPAIALGQSFFPVLWIGIFCQCGSGYGSGSRSRALATKNLKIFTAEKSLYTVFGSKIAIYIFLGLHKGRPSYRGSLSSLEREHLATSKLEFSLLLWVILALLDPDPDPNSQCGSGTSRQNECESGSTALLFPKEKVFYKL